MKIDNGTPNPTPENLRKKIKWMAKIGLIRKKLYCTGTQTRNVVNRETSASYERRSERTLED